MPTEKTIEKSIRRAAEGAGWLTIKMHGGPMTRAGLPDLLCVRSGDVRWIEVKQPKGQPTPLQFATMLRLNKQGTPARVCRSVEDAMAFLGEDAFVRNAIDPAVRTTERRRMEVKRECRSDRPRGVGSRGAGRRVEAGAGRGEAGLPG
ncbi:MAG: VRR-NUC domain-containing protein [Planctomycetes bacterium]|nr:VRR-NUC domain-containing protein [Planctomycetota bacterium]